MIEELMKNFEIRHGFSTSYHPKTNGLVERFNKTLCESLAKLGGNKDWDRKIALVLFAYRNKRQESTKIKPFYLTYGREARLPTDIMDTNPYTQE
jgi:transposase InsO family protein